jgi:hypothetical protein
MAGEPGVFYKAGTGGGTSNAPDLRAPLGAPSFLKPEDFIALANFNDPTVALKNAYDLTSSLIDNHYKNQMALAKSQADLAETAARTDQLGVNTDLLKQDYENRAKLNPIAQQAAQNRLDSDAILLDQQKRNAQDQNTAIAQMPEAISELPKPDDPDYANKRDQWRLKYNNLLTNPATKTRMEGEYQAVDGVYQNLISTQQTNAKRKEFGDLQTQGFIPSPINPDAAMKSPDADTILTRGRMAQARHAIEATAAQLPAESPQRAQLQAMLNEAESDIGSDTGTQDVTAGKSKVFDTNGRLTGNAQGALQQAQNVLAAQGKAELAKPQAEVEVPFGKPDLKGNVPKLILKGVEPSVAETWAQKYGLKPPGQEAQPAAGTNLLQVPAVRDLSERFLCHEITREQFLDQLKVLSPPQAQQVPYGPGNPNPVTAPTSYNTIPNHALPKPASVAEARALPRGTHFLDPQGKRRMVA